MFPLLPLTTLERNRYSLSEPPSVVYFQWNPQPNVKRGVSSSGFSSPPPLVAPLCESESSDRRAESLHTPLSLRVVSTPRAMRGRFPFSLSHSVFFTKTFFSISPTVFSIFRFLTCSLPSRSLTSSRSTESPPECSFPSTRSSPFWASWSTGLCFPTPRCAPLRDASFSLLYNLGFGNNAMIPVGAVSCIHS